MPKRRKQRDIGAHEKTKQYLWWATEKRNKTAGPKRGPVGLSHYGRNYKPTRQAAKKKTKIGTRNIKPIIIRSSVSD